METKPQTPNTLKTKSFREVGTPNRPESRIQKNQVDQEDPILGEKDDVEIWGDKTINTVTHRGQEKMQTNSVTPSEQVAKGDCDELNDFKPQSRNFSDQIESSIHKKSMRYNSQLVRYNFEEYCTMDSSIQLLKKMSYQIPLKDLYEIEKTCSTNEDNTYCPLVLKINDNSLQTLYGGKYLLQVWYKNKVKLYERVLQRQIESMSLIGDYFLFFADPKEEKDSSTDLYGLFEVVKFKQDSVEYMMKLRLQNQKQKGKISEHVAVIWRNNLIVANRNQMLHLDIEKLIKKRQSTAASDKEEVFDINYSDLKKTQILDGEDKWKIHTVQEIERDTENNSHCMIVCEDTTTGKLKFLQIDAVQKDKIFLQDLAPVLASQKNAEKTEILEMRSVMSRFSDKHSIKHFAVALCKNLSVDFYYEYRNVETVVSEKGCIFFSVDLDFRYIHFNSLDFERKELTNYNCYMGWMQKIGMSVTTDLKKQKVSELKEDYDEVLDVYKNQASDLLWNDSVAQKLQNVQRTEVEEIILLMNFYKKQKNVGVQSICATYAKIYTSFINNGHSLLISHGAYISAFNMKSEKWSEHHFQFNDQVRQIFSLRKQTLQTDEDSSKIGVLVGYKTLFFFEWDAKKHIVYQGQKKTTEPISSFLNDLDSKQAFYMICPKKAQAKQYLRKINQNTFFHSPIQLNAQDPAKVIKVFVNDDIYEIEANQTNQNFTMCIQRGKEHIPGKIFKQVLILDSPHQSMQELHIQLHLHLTFSEQDKKVVVSNQQQYFIDYSSYQEKFENLSDDIISQISFQVHDQKKEKTNFENKSCEKNFVQITKNHLLIMRKEDLEVDKQLDGLVQSSQAGHKLVLEKVFEHRNISNMIYDPNNFLVYAIQNLSITYDNQIQKPYGPIHPTGLFVYDFLELVMKRQVADYILDHTIALSYDLIDYNQEEETIAYMKEFTEIRVIPMPHKNTSKFFGMGKKQNYLIWHEKMGTFTALDKKLEMTMWSTVTGKILKSTKDSQIRNKSTPRKNQSIDFEVYKANSQDASWTNNTNAEKEFSYSLVVAAKPFETGQLRQNELDITDISQHDHSVLDQSHINLFDENTSRTKLYVSGKGTKLYEFNILEISWKKGIDEDLNENGKAISVQFNNEPVKQVSWKEKMRFKLRLPENKEKRPFIYLSKDAQKLFVLEEDQFDPLIYECQQTGSEVVWVEKHRINQFPTLLQGSCSKNFLLSPNFERFIDFDFKQNCFLIKDTETEKIIKTIPHELLKVTWISKNKSEHQIALVGQRIMFHSIDQIRILNLDSLDIIFSIDQETNNSVQSYVAVDNFEQLNFGQDRHAFIDKAELSKDNTFKRLIRKNAEIKQARAHYQIEQGQKMKKSGKFDEKEFEKDLRFFAYNQIFQVDYSLKDFFIVDSSFTILDWIVMDRLLKNSEYNFSQVETQQSVQLFFNIFPRVKTVLHLLAENELVAIQQQAYIQPIFKAAASGEISDGNPITIPIILDDENKTALDICLQEKTLNTGLASLLFRQSQDYPLLHSSHLLQSAVCQAIKYQVLGIGEYMDARIKQTQNLERSESMVQNAIKAELKYEVNDQSLAWQECSIWENKSVISKKMFDEKGVKHRLNHFYFDIPDINDRTKKSNEFFYALLETKDCTIFDRLCVKIIINKAWAEHRILFACFYLLPALMLISVYHIFCNYVSVDPSNSEFNNDQDRKSLGFACCIIIFSFALIFICLDMHYIFLKPKEYFSSFWNVMDFSVIFFVVINPILWLRNYIYCEMLNNSDQCTNFTPNWQPDAVTKFKYYAQAFANLLLWLKLLYYLKMFDATAYIIRAISGILKNLSAFLVVLLIATLAFSAAFKSASEYHQFFLKTSDETYYTSYLDAWVNTYTFIMAAQGVLNYQNSVLCFILWLGCSIFIYLQMLNLLIACVAGSFADTIAAQEEYVLRERVILINDTRRSPFYRFFVKPSGDATFTLIMKQVKLSDQEQKQDAQK